MKAKPPVAVEVCRDGRLLNRLLAHIPMHPRFGARMDVAPLVNRHDIVFLLAKVHDSEAGVVMLIGEEAHISIKPMYRGLPAMEIARAAIQWIKANRPVPRLRTFSYDSRPDVSSFVSALGFVRDGTTERVRDIAGKEHQQIGYAMEVA